MDKLKGVFPHYVSYLGDDAVGSQDSGLMLFGRFPFEPLPVGAYKAESDDVDARNGGDDFLTTTIQGLPVDKTSDLSKSNTLASAGGEYLFRYNRSRSLQMAP
ncbi:MAG: hypothetical protein KJ052_17770 [Candidatus Hydrogenedentes bacterium]|nr:hypothetical protein [Candidatus Hydrogenedentota bacterium]